MGAAELYITLLSVCERLLKALKSPGSDTGPLPATKLPQTDANDNVSQVCRSHDKRRVGEQVGTCSEGGVRR